MPSISDIVTLVHPTVSGTGIILSDQIWVLFDRELDEGSIKDNFFITGPDQDTWSGPDLLLFHDKTQVGDEEDILESPNYKGIVQGVYTYQKINPTNYETHSGYDYSGDGNLWRTKVIFTPTNRLSASTTYYVYLSGDESSTDDLTTGISARTIFDVVKGANLGTGNVTFSGTYAGTANDTLNVRITTAGEVGTSRFVWWRSSAPALVFGPYPTALSASLLVEGVKVAFDTGTWVVGDTFAVVVKVRSSFTGNLVWPFETGSGSIEAVPSEASTSVLGEPSTSTATTTFSVEDTTPDDQATNLDIVDADLSVVVDFSDDVDATTLVGNISVVIDPVNGDEANITHSGIYTGFATSVVDDLLTIVIPSGMLHHNNVVTITLDENIASTAGVTLGADYEFYFTTTYDPLYSSVRKVRLEYGALLTSVVDDTVNLAIFEGSLAADQITWATTISLTQWYNWVRREWTTCKAAEILLLNVIMGSGGIKGKKLGDLEVQYDTKVLQNALDKAVGCLGKWEMTLNGGGNAVQTAGGVIKGAWDPDRPPIGRGWEQSSSLNQKYYPGATGKSLSSSSRRWISGFYSSSKGRTGKGNTH